MTTAVAAGIAVLPEVLKGVSSLIQSVGKKDDPQTNEAVEKLQKAVDALEQWMKHHEPQEKRQTKLLGHLRAFAYASGTIHVVMAAFIVYLLVR